MAFAIIEGRENQPSTLLREEYRQLFANRHQWIFVLDRDDIIISYQPQRTNNIRSLGFTVERVVYGGVRLMQLA